MGAIPVAHESQVKKCGYKSLHGVCSFAEGQEETSEDSDEIVSLQKMLKLLTWGQKRLLG